MTNLFSEYSFDIESSALLLPEKITFCHSCDSTRRYDGSCDETAHKYIDKKSSQVRERPLVTMLVNQTTCRTN